MTTGTFSANERAPVHSLTALALLADPVSALLDQGRLVAITYIAFREDQPTRHSELALFRECVRDLGRLREKLKQAFTIAYADGDMDDATMQRLIDRFELWSD
jgi:hypothetical protein